MAKKIKTKDKKCCVTCKYIAQDCNDGFNCVERMGSIGLSTNFFTNIYRDNCNAYQRRAKDIKIPKYD